MGWALLFPAESSSQFRSAVLLVISLLVLPSNQEPADLSFHSTESLHQTHEQLESTFHPAPVIRTVRSSVGIRVAQDYKNKWDPVFKGIKSSVYKDNPLATLASIGMQSTETVSHLHHRELPVENVHKSNSAPHPCSAYWPCKTAKGEVNKETILKASKPRKCNDYGCSGYARGLKQLVNIGANRSVVLITKNGIVGEDAASTAPSESKNLDLSTRSVVLITSVDPPPDDEILISPELEPEIDFDGELQTDPTSSKSVVLIVADEPQGDSSSNDIISEPSPFPEMDEDLQIDEVVLNFQPAQEPTAIPISEVDEDVDIGDSHLDIQPKEEPTVAPDPEEEDDFWAGDVLSDIQPMQEPTEVSIPQADEDVQIGDSNLDAQPERDPITVPAPEVGEDVQIDDAFSDIQPKQYQAVAPVPEADEHVQIDDSHTDVEPEEEPVLAPIPDVDEKMHNNALLIDQPEQEPLSAPIEVGEEEQQVDDKFSNQQPEQEPATTKISETIQPAAQILAPSVEDPSQAEGFAPDYLNATNVEEKTLSLQEKGDVLVELLFEELDYDSMMKEGELEQELQTFILSSIATYGDLHEEDVSILRIRRGSVIVDASLVLQNNKDVERLLGNLSNNPEGVFPESPYGVPKVSVIGGSIGNQFLQSVRGTIQDSTLEEQSLQVPESPIPLTQLDDTEANELSAGSMKSPEAGIPLVGSDDNGYAILRLTFDWLNVIEDDTKADSLRRTAMSVMTQANGTYQGHADIVKFVPAELSTEVVVKVSMATGNDVYDFQHLFDVLNLDPPQPAWVFGDTFTYGEFLPPRVTFLEIANEEGAVFMLTSSARRNTLVCFISFLCAHAEYAL